MAAGRGHADGPEGEIMEETGFHRKKQRARGGMTVGDRTCTGVDGLEDGVDELAELEGVLQTWRNRVLSGRGDLGGAFEAVSDAFPADVVARLPEPGTIDNWDDAVQEVFDEFSSAEMMAWRYEIVGKLLSGELRCNHPIP